MPKLPTRTQRFNPNTGLEEVRYYLEWNSEAEFRKWLDELKEEMKPHILKELQTKARSLFKDIFGKEL